METPRWEDGEGLPQTVAVMGDLRYEPVRKLENEMDLRKQWEV